MVVINFFSFAPMLNSLTLGNNKKVTESLSTWVSPEIIKPFDTGLAPIMTNLAKGKVSLKCNNSVLVHGIVTLF